MNKHYIAGSELTSTQRAKVLAVFVHRDTKEHPWNSTARMLLGSERSRSALPSDAEWVASKCFRFYKNGRVAGCLPASFAC